METKVPILSNTFCHFLLVCPQRKKSNECGIQVTHLQHFACHSLHDCWVLQRHFGGYPESQQGECGTDQGGFSGTQGGKVP